MFSPALSSIRARLFLILVVSGLFSLLLLGTAVFSLNQFRNDIQQVSSEVAHASEALSLVSRAQNAFQAQVRGMKNMIIRNFMPEEFDKAKTEFLTERSAFWKSIEALEVLGSANQADFLPQLAELREKAKELNTLYDEVLAENEAGMPKYTLMVDAALRGAEQPLTNALDSMASHIHQQTKSLVSAAPEIADQQFDAKLLMILVVGLCGTAASFCLALYQGKSILARLGRA